MLKTESIMNKFTVILIILVMFSTKTIAQTAHMMTAKSVEVSPDKRNVTRTIEKVINKKHWELTLKNDEVTNVKISGKTLGKAYYGKYQAEIDQLKTAAYDMQTPSGEVGQEVFKLSEYQNSSAPMSEQEKTASKMIEDALVQDGLVKDDYRFYRLVLTDKQMTVEGKVMSKEMHQKYVALYYTYSGEQACEGCHFKISTNKAK
jgi:Skp family chaperone for outer membrane proteins